MGRAEPPPPEHGEVADPGPEEGRLEQAIAGHARRLRRGRGVTLTEMAVRVGISKAMLSKIENAQISCSLTTLSRLAGALEVPVTALFRGADVDREAVHTPVGAPQRMEAHLVTLTERSEVFPLYRHPGTELLYMLEGVMVYGHGAARYTLAAGDALQLDGEDTRGPLELRELPIRFLSVVAHAA